MNDKEKSQSEKKNRPTKSSEDNEASEVKVEKPTTSNLASIETKLDKLTELITVLAQSLVVNQEKQNERSSEDEFVAKALASEEIRAQIIAEYLKSLTNNDSVRVLRSDVGSTPLTPAHKPKSLADAKKLAELLIKR